MTLWLVTWLAITQDCPFWAKPLPSQYKPFICQEKRQYEWILTSYRSEAEKHVIDRNGDALLLEMTGTRAKKKKIEKVVQIHIEP